jgi:hypothetical protein
LSLLVAASPSRTEEDRLRSAREGGGETPVARIRVRYADGSESTSLLQYGIDTWKPDGDPRILALWRTAGVVSAGSTPGQPPGDRTLFRVDWHNPRPEVPVAGAQLETDHPQVLLLVGGALSLR